MDGATLLSDAVVTHALRGALAVILLLGAASKLRDPPLFRASLENYRLLPDGLLTPGAWLVALCELACGAAMLAWPTEPATVWLASALLGTVTAALAINLLRGHRHIDCGCGGLAGHVGQQSLSWALVGRNAVLLAAAWLAAGSPADRALLWVDYLSVAGATLGLLGAYAATNQLIANQPRLQALKRH